MPRCLGMLGLGAVGGVAPSCLPGRTQAKGHQGGAGGCRAWELPLGLRLKVEGGCLLGEEGLWVGNSHAAALTTASPLHSAIS